MRYFLLFTIICMSAILLSLQPLVAEDNPDFDKVFAGATGKPVDLSRDESRWLAPHVPMYEMIFPEGIGYNFLVINPKEVVKAAETKHKNQVAMLKHRRDPLDPDQGYTPFVFFWPDRELFSKQDDLFTGYKTLELEWSDTFATNVRKLLTLDPKLPSLKLYEHNKCLRYYFPVAEQTLIRFVNSPWEPLHSQNFTSEVQFLSTVGHPDENIQDLMKAMVNWKFDRTIAENKVDLIANVISAAPLTERIKKADWHLQNFGFDHDFGVVNVTFTAKVDVTHPTIASDALYFRLHAVIGPKGDLLVLCGKGLEGLAAMKE